MRTRTSGMSLLFIASAIIFIVVLAAGFLFLTRILGGNVEMSNAVDAGILTVAKRAILNPTVDVEVIGTPEFKGLGDPNRPNLISLDTYNRAVAATLLIALNASDLQTAEATANAKLQIDQLAKLSRSLADAIRKDPQLNNAFHSVADANSLRMLGSQASIRSDRSIECAYFEPGGPTNVQLDSRALPPTFQLSNFVADGSGNYIAGYKSLRVGSFVLCGTPVFPGESPHLIRKDLPPLPDCGVAQNDIPPNAFRRLAELGDQSDYRISKMQMLGCATVGDIGRTYHAALPKAYVKIVNLKGFNPKTFMNQMQLAQNNNGGAPGATGTTGGGGSKKPLTWAPKWVPWSTYMWGSSIKGGGGGSSGGGSSGGSSGAVDEQQGGLVTDGSNDIFNKELFDPSAILEADNGVFTTDNKQMQAWISYNSLGRPDSLYPPARGYDVRNMHFGNEGGSLANLDQLKSMRSTLCECNHKMYTAELRGPCADKDRVAKWAKNYGRASVISSYDKDQQIMALEYVKARILEARAAVPRQYSCEIALPQPSGLKLFNRQKRAVGPPLEFSTEGTPWQLLQHVGPCASSGTTFQKIVRACVQMKPKATTSEIEKLLNSRKLQLGTTLYLYVGTNNQLVLDEKGPEGLEPITPDGRRAPTECQTSYPVLRTLVNTASQGGTPGDAGFDDAPWSGVKTTADGVDRAVWTGHSGYKNLLGVLEFENDLTGAIVLDQPN